MLNNLGLNRNNFKLNIGDKIELHILKKHSDKTATATLNNKRLVIESKDKIPSSPSVKCIVKNFNPDKNKLVVTIDKKQSSIDIKQVLFEFGIKDTDSNRKIVLLLLQNGIKLSRDNINLAIRLFTKAGDSLFIMLFFKSNIDIKYLNKVLEIYQNQNQLSDTAGILPGLNPDLSNLELIIRKYFGFIKSSYLTLLQEAINRMLKEKKDSILDKNIEYELLKNGNNDNSINRILSYVIYRQLLFKYLNIALFNLSCNKDNNDTMNFTIERREKNVFYLKIDTKNFGSLLSVIELDNNRIVFYCESDVIADRLNKKIHVLSSKLNIKEKNFYINAVGVKQKENDIGYEYWA